MKKYITWNNIDKFVKTIFTKYRNKINGVLRLPRGGLTLAATISHVMDIPMLASPCKSCLIIDDICDSDRSLLHDINNSSNLEEAHQYEL